MIKTDVIVYKKERIKKIYTKYYDISNTLQYIYNTETYQLKFIQKIEFDKIQIRIII